MRSNYQRVQLGKSVAFIKPKGNIHIYVLPGDSIERVLYQAMRRWGPFKVIKQDRNFIWVQLKRFL